VDDSKGRIYVHIHKKTLNRGCKESIPTLIWWIKKRNINYFTVISFGKLKPYKTFALLEIKYKLADIGLCSSTRHPPHGRVLLVAYKRN